MSRPSRTVLTTAALLLSGPALAACGAGLGAQNAIVRSVTTGVSGQIGDIALRNVYLQPDGNTDTIDPGGSGYLVATIVNVGTQPDTLTDVSTDVAGTATVTTGRSPSPSASPRSASPSPSASPRPASPSPSPTRSPRVSPSPSTTPSGAGGTAFRPTVLKPGDLLVLSAPGAGGPGPGQALKLSGFRQTTRTGATIAVTFDLQRAGRLVMQVPVARTTGSTSIVAPPSSASPPPTPSPTRPVPVPTEVSPSPSAVVATKTP